MANTEQLRRVPPHNDEAEKSVLSVLISHKEAYDKVSQVIDASCFYHPQNAVIFSAIDSMKSDNKVAVDQITLIKYLSEKNLLEKAGGVQYVSSITDSYSIFGNVEAYAKIIKEASLRRNLITLAYKYGSDAYDESQDITQLLDECAHNLGDVSLTSKMESVDSYKAATHINDVLDEIIAKAGGEYENKNIETGFHLLDNYTNGGFNNSDYIIIAARPSIGKTAFAVSLIRNMLHKSYKVAFFSLEMPAKQILQRLLACTSKVDLSRILLGTTLTQEDISEIENTAESIYNSSFYLVDEPNMKLADLRTRARMLKRECDIDIIFIDYIGLIESGLSPNTPKHEQVGYVSKAMKQLARELKIPVVVLCQVSRDSEDNEPQLNNLRDSGSIEQDADLVMFIHRRKNLSELSEEDKAKLIADNKGRNRIQSSKLLIAKNRNGKTGTIFVGYNGDITSFESIAQDKNLFIESPKDPMKKK